MREKRYTFLSLVSAVKIVCVFLIVLFAGLAIAGQIRTTVHVAPDSVVESDRIELGKVSQIGGDPSRFERLKNISLGYAPSIGMTREISRDLLVLAIKAAGFADGEFNLDSPATILVRRMGQNVTTSQIHDAVERTVLDQFKTGSVTAQITRLDVPDAIQVPVGTVEIRTSLSGVRSLFERFSIPVEIRVGNKIVRSFVVTVEIAAYADVLVAATDLAVNKKLGDADVRVANCRIEKPLSTYLRDKANLRGMQLVKAVETGKPITNDSFAAGVVIKFGDPVRIEAQSGRIKIIIITGEARSAGKIGDRIAVRNTQSGAILQAVILDEGLVKVIF